MKYRHYAPGVPLVCVNGSSDFFKKTVSEALKDRKRIGVMISRENSHAADFEEDEKIEVRFLGSKNDLKEVSKNLFDCLRTLDKTDVEEIFSETFATDGMGFALMNRLLKAASGRCIQE